jgi:hypothetical protein
MFTYVWVHILIISDLAKNKSKTPTKAQAISYNDDHGSSVGFLPADAPLQPQ